MAIRDELKLTDHRPWPLPDKPWVMVQTWTHLLFMHYAVPIDVMRAAVPEHIPLDTYDGQTWIGVVPFRMSFVRPRHMPAVPWLSFFPELNVRTYVTVGGKAGVYFFSLEAANPVAVWLARSTFHLPYFNARMTCWDKGTRIEYRSKRTHRGAPPAEFEAHYGADGPIQRAEAGSLEEWFTERYALYTTNKKGEIVRGEIHHRRWPIRPAWADVTTNTMLQSHGFAQPETEPLLHFVDRIKVIVWPIEKVTP